MLFRSEWKWDEIGMDFITGFPKSQKGNNAIWVVVDRLSKVAHFLPVREDITAIQLADLYISRILVLHGVPKKIISDRGSLFTSKFWTSFQQAMGTRVNFTTAFHPQGDGQVERARTTLMRISSAERSAASRCAWAASSFRRQRSTVS